MPTPPLQSDPFAKGFVQLGPIQAKSMHEAVLYLGMWHELNITRLMPASTVEVQATDTVDSELGRYIREQLGPFVEEVITRIRIELDLELADARKDLESRYGIVLHEKDGVLHRVL